MKDIVTTANAAVSNSYSNVTMAGTTGYMYGWTETTGTELWKTDGTAAGTVLVKDICPGTCSGSPYNLTAMGRTLFFYATDGKTGFELWKSDGTAAGTVLVKDINPGDASSYPYFLINVSGTLYFQASDGKAGTELWKSDGTEAGTTLVADIWAGSSGSNPTGLANLNGVLIFAARDANGYELWRSDGTEAGTVLVADILEGDGSSNPVSLVAIGSSVYFAADDGLNGSELWKSNGTAAGTVLVKDIYVGGASSPGSLTALGSTLYFTATDGSSGVELWKSDGSTAGTVMVKDIYAGASSSTPWSFTTMGSTLYFAASDASGTGLWKSDGTTAGTTLVSPAGVSLPSSGVAFKPAIVGTSLYFDASDGTNGAELWKSDGTSAGTTLVKDILAGGGSSYPGNFSTVNGVLFFRAYGSGDGYEYWRSDGTAAGTVMVTDTKSVSSSPGSAVDVNGTLFFAAADPAGVSGWQALWKTDGTEAGTQMVGRTGLFCSSASPLNLIANGGTLFFVAQTCTTPPTPQTYALWKSDGTTAGTTPLSPSTVSASTSYPVMAGGTVYFVGSDGTNGAELWKSDGTPAGTVLVKDIYAGSSSSSPGYLTAVGNTLYFGADDGTNGFELWKSDGTAAGTKLVKSIVSGSGSSSPAYLTNVNGTLYFRAGQSGAGYELWRSDGTSAGTVMVKEIFPGPNGSSPYNLTNVNGTLFFVAQDGSAASSQTLSGYELWKSDGTKAGTVQVLDIKPGPESSNPSNLYAAGSTLYFTADDGVHGDELWKSDGTAAGTSLVIDMVPGSEYGYYLGMASVPGGVLFMSDDGVHGVEPWFSDGTLAGPMAADEGKVFGTHMLQDINPGSGSSGLGMAFTKALGGTFFGATDGTTGVELWWLPPALSITDTVMTEASSGSSNATLTVTLSNASTAAVTVGFATVDGTAVAGTDYAAASGTLTFLPGETTKTISVVVKGDAVPEDTKAFTVVLTNAVRAYVADGHGQVKIFNNQPPLNTYTQPVWHPFFAVDTRETPMVGDFNGDKMTDIVTFTRDNPNAVGDVYVALSNGAGFGANAKWNDWFAISQDETVVIGDFDGDGKDDIATWLGKSSRQVYVARSTGSGMQPGTVWLTSIGSDSSDVLLSGDVNGDGKKDLVLFARKQGKVYVAVSDGTKFGTATVWHGFFAVSTYERPRVADVNGDGRADIVTFATDSPTAFGDVYVAVSNGTKFVDQNGVAGSSTKWHDWFSIDANELIGVGDVNGDGKDDFFTFLPPSRGGDYYMVVSMGTAMGPNVLASEKVRRSTSDRVFVGDVNGDRKADVIGFAQSQGKVYVTLAR